MKNTFKINYKDREITIEQSPADKLGNIYYVAHLPAENLRIEYTEDDEGAGHWIDEKTNQETEVSLEIGQLIELYMVQHKMST